MPFTVCHTPHQAQYCSFAIACQIKKTPPRGAKKGDFCLVRTSRWRYSHKLPLPLRLCRVFLSSHRVRFLSRYAGRSDYSIGASQRSAFLDMSGQILECSFAFCKPSRCLFHSRKPLPWRKPAFSISYVTMNCATPKQHQRERGSLCLLVAGKVERVRQFESRTRNC